MFSEIKNNTFWFPRSIPCFTDLQPPEAPRNYATDEEVKDFSNKYRTYTESKKEFSKKSALEQFLIAIPEVFIKYKFHTQASSITLSSLKTIFNRKLEAPTESLTLLALAIFQPILVPIVIDFTKFAKDVNSIYSSSYKIINVVVLQPNELTGEEKSKFIKNEVGKNVMKIMNISIFLTAIFYRPPGGEVALKLIVLSAKSSQKAIKIFLAIHKSYKSYQGDKGDIVSGIITITENSLILLANKYKADSLRFI